jgi:hypothetical protein
MATLLQQLRLRNRISRALLFGCALALATIVSPPEVLAQVTTTICKKTVPSSDPTLFTFTGANGFATGPNSFGSLYPPGPFNLQDGSCKTFNITGHDQFNKFTETVPPGWTLTNITCSHTTSAVSIIGANPNPAFQPGDNTVTIDQTEPNVTCTFVNQRGTGDGLLKVCKVAGPGVAVGTSFSFTAGAGTFTVPAGPAPNGTCVVGPAFPVGSNVTVTETIPAGDTVSSITVAPPGQLVGTPNLAGGSVNVMIGSGVTEVTFTDKRTGFLEICKNGDVEGNFNFSVNPGGLGPFAVPAGACSPAIEVVAGSVLINEMPSAGATMAGCATIPPGQQGPCNPGAQTSTVTIAPGDVSTMTIAFVTNKKITGDTGPVVIPNLPMQGGNENTPCPQTGVVVTRANAPSVPYLNIMLANLDLQCATKGPGFKLLSIKFLTCRPDPRGPGFGPNATADLTCG